MGARHVAALIRCRPDAARASAWPAYASCVDRAHYTTLSRAATWPYGANGKMRRVLLGPQLPRAPENSVKISGCPFLGVRTQKNTSK